MPLKESVLIHKGCVGSTSASQIMGSLSRERPQGSWMYLGVLNRTLSKSWGLGDLYHVMLLFLIQCHVHTTRDCGKFCLLSHHLLLYQKLFRPFSPTVAAAIGLVISSDPPGCKIEFTQVGTQLDGHPHIGRCRLGMHPSMLSCQQPPWKAEWP